MDSVIMEKLKEDLEGKFSILDRSKFEECLKNSGFELLGTGNPDKQFWTYDRRPYGVITLYIDWVEHFIWIFV